jgi:Domain of unknown function (DUF4136)
MEVDGREGGIMKLQKAVFLLIGLVLFLANASFAQQVKTDWGFGESTTTVDSYKVGSLVVDLFDAKTTHMVWRGSSSDTLSNKSDKNIKNLNKAVQKMFQHFPPEEPKK